MRTATLTLALIGVAAGGLGQVVVDQLGGPALAPRTGATVKYVDPADGPVYPVRVNHAWGLMNRQGSLVLYPDFDWIDADHDGLIRATRNGKTGFLLGSGGWRFEPTWAYADRFEEGFAVVGDGEGKFGYLDKAGKLRVPLRLDGALRFKDGAAAVLIDGKVGFIDTRGQSLISPRFRRARSFHDGVAMAEAFAEDGESAGTLGYIDKRGRWVARDTRGRFADLGDFNEGYAKAKVGDFWGYVDRNLRPRIEPAFQDARDFVAGVAAVKRDGKWGYINKRGDVVIEPRFEEADDFDETLALVKLDGRYGYIDKRGDFVVPATFDDARPFFRKYARVGDPAGFTYIDVTGRTHWDAAAAANGFVNLRTKEDLEMGVRKTDKYNRHLPPPIPRPVAPEPYAPEHRYDEILPPPPGD